MGTLTNGIKEIFATAKSTGTNVMLCGNDGTPDGHMTMSNLSLFLSGINGFKDISSTMSDFNDVTTPGKYIVKGGQTKTNKPEDLLNTSYCSLFVYPAADGVVFQVLYRGYGSFQSWARSFYPSTTSWTPWVHTDGFGCSTVSDLASVLGDTSEGMHFKVIASARLYTGSDNPRNYPTVYGTHVKIASYYAIHLLVDSQGNHMWFGTSTADGDHPNAWISIV